MKKFVALLAGALLMMATSAMAIPIEGKINFNGALSLVGGNSLSTSTGINFSNPAVVGDGSTGIYSSLPSFPSAWFTATPVQFQSITFDSVLTTPVMPLWTLTFDGKTFDFDLTSIVSITDTSIIGYGVLGATDYDDTKGIFQLTTQNIGSGTLSFSATSVVPEPGTMMLLGFGMLGLAIYGKRRMNKEA